MPEPLASTPDSLSNNTVDVEILIAWNDMLLNASNVPIQDFINDPRSFADTKIVQGVMDQANMSSRATRITVPGSPSTISFDVTSDFIASDHCGPVAGLNILKYYHETGRVCTLYSKSFFYTIYDNMKTNQPIGTLSSTFCSGLNKTLNWFGTTGYNVYATTNNWSSYKGLINAGYPVPMMFYKDQWASSENLGNDQWDWHWVMGTAWLEDSTSSGTINYIYAANGWDNYVVFRSVGRNNDAPADMIIYANVGYWS